MSNINYEINTQPSKELDEVVINGVHNYNNNLHNDPVSHHSIYAKSDNKIIGGALIYQHSDAIYIDSLWVDDKYRNQGIGSELLRRTEQDCLEKGIPKQIISTFNKRAKELYINHGFKVIATVPNYIQGLDKYYLEKIANKDSVKGVYNKIAKWFDNARTKTLEMEDKYLQLITKIIPQGGSILDAGCGSGEPLAEYFINAGYVVTGFDFSETMIDLCRSRFPNNEWFTADMRSLSINSQFDCVLAWHSFFHIPKEQQKDVLENLCNLVKSDGLLCFTSGIENGEVWSNNGGQMLFHASLASSEYNTILSNNNMKVLAHNVSDPDCGNATVWVAQKSLD